MFISLKLKTMSLRQSESGETIGVVFFFLTPRRMTFETVSMIFVSKTWQWFCPCTEFKINKSLASFKHAKSNRCVLCLKDQGNPYLQFEYYLYPWTSLAVKGSQRILIWIASKSKFKMHNLSRIFI